MFARALRTSFKGVRSRAPLHTWGSKWGVVPRQLNRCSKPMNRWNQPLSRWSKPMNRSYFTRTSKFGGLTSRYARLAPSVVSKGKSPSPWRVWSAVRRGFATFREQTATWQNVGVALTPEQKAMWVLFGTAALVGIGTAATYNAEAGQYEGEWQPYVAERVSAVFKHLAGSVAFTAAVATLSYKSGIMLAPTSIAGAIALTVGMMLSMYATFATDYQENPTGKYIAWGVFQTIMGTSLALYGCLGGPVVMKAALGTLAILGSTSLVAMNANSDQFLWMRGMLSCGLGIVFVASLARLFMPASALMDSVVLYGGLGLFSAFCLYDVGKVVDQAKVTHPSAMWDPINPSISIYMDLVNIFIRLAQIFSNGNRK